MYIEYVVLVSHLARCYPCEEDSFGLNETGSRVCWHLDTEEMVEATEVRLAIIDRIRLVPISWPLVYEELVLWLV